MPRVDTGLLLFLEDPSRTVARWGDPSGAAGEGILAALHEDQLHALAGVESTAIYISGAGADDQAYVDEVARRTSLETLAVPGGRLLERWDAGLSILFNRCAHRKVLAVDAGVPGVGPDDIARARRKLDLYRVILGREGEDRCWLIGFNGYEELLGRAEVRPDDVLHPLLQAAGRVGLDVSLLDTKTSLAGGLDLELVRGLARQPGFHRLQAAVDELPLPDGA